MPEADSLVQLPWKKEVAWITGDLVMAGKPVTQNPRQVLKKAIAAAAAQGYELKTGVECEYFLISQDGTAIFRRRRRAGEALLRPAGVDAPI